MSTIQWLGLLVAAALGATVALFKKYYMPSTDNDFIRLPTEPPKPDEVLPDTITVTKPLETPILGPVDLLLWDTPRHAFHSTRVLCDEAGLILKQKDEICATIYGESEFDNKAICKNRNEKGEVTSIDVGICQINSYWHCGKGKTFPSTDYVVAHPEEAVRFMMKMYKAGQINLWIAHKNKRYLKFIPKGSKMWLLA